MQGGAPSPKGGAGGGGTQGGRMQGSRFNCGMERQEGRVLSQQSGIGGRGGRGRGAGLTVARRDRRVGSQQSGMGAGRGMREEKGNLQKFAAL